MIETPPSEGDNPDPKPNQIWQHYKGGCYLIQSIGTHSETGERMVAYMDKQSKIWFRPLSMWHNWVRVEKDVHFENGSYGIIIAQERNFVRRFVKVDPKHLKTPELVESRTNHEKH